MGGRGRKGCAAIQLYSTDIDVEICFVSTDDRGKNKTSLSLLVNLCLVVTWISSKKSTQLIHLPCSLHVSHAFNLSWLRGIDSCDIYSSSKSCHNLMYLKSQNETIAITQIVSKIYRLFHNGYLHFLKLQVSFALIWSIRTICLYIYEYFCVQALFLYIGLTHSATLMSKSWASVVPNAWVGNTSPALPNLLKVCPVESDRDWIVMLLKMTSKLLLSSKSFPFTFCMLLG